MQPPSGGKSRYQIMGRNKNAGRGHARIYNPIEHLEYVTKQNLYGIAVQDAKKVKDACAKWEEYLKLQELLKQLKR